MRLCYISEHHGFEMDTLITGNVGCQSHKIAQNISITEKSNLIFAVNFKQQGWLKIMSVRNNEET